MRRREFIAAAESRGLLRFTRSTRIGSGASAFCARRRRRNESSMPMPATLVARADEVIE